MVCIVILLGYWKETENIICMEKEEIAREAEAERREAEETERN